MWEHVGAHSLAHLANMVAWEKRRSLGYEILPDLDARSSNA